MLPSSAILDHRHRISLVSAFGDEFAVRAARGFADLCRLPVQLFPSKGIIISTFRSLESIQDWCSISKEKREVIQLGVPNRNAADIKFSIPLPKSMLEVIRRLLSLQKANECYFNQGTPRNVRLDGEK